MTICFRTARSLIWALRPRQPRRPLQLQRLGRTLRWSLRFHLRPNLPSCWIRKCCSGLQSLGHRRGWMGLMGRGPWDRLLRLAPRVAPALRPSDSLGLLTRSAPAPRAPRPISAHRVPLACHHPPPQPPQEHQPDPLLLSPLRRLHLAPQPGPLQAVPLVRPQPRRFALQLPPRQFVKPGPLNPALPRCLCRPAKPPSVAALPPAERARRCLEPQSRLPPRRAAHLHRRAKLLPPRSHLRRAASLRVTPRAPEARRPFPIRNLTSPRRRAIAHLQLQHLSPLHRPGRHSKRPCRICPSS